MISHSLADDEISGQLRRLRLICHPRVRAPRRRNSELREIKEDGLRAYFRDEFNHVDMYLVGLILLHQGVHVASLPFAADWPELQDQVLLPLPTPLLPLGASASKPHPTRASKRIAMCFDPSPLHDRAQVAPMRHASALFRCFCRPPVCAYAPPRARRSRCRCARSAASSRGCGCSRCDDAR